MKFFNIMAKVEIDIPEGYIIDKENSTFECIKFKSKNEVCTYKEVAKGLFENKKVYYITSVGTINYGYYIDKYIQDTNTAVSKKQLEKLIAINKLMNVARYLNDGWSPTNLDTYYYIVINTSFRNTEYLIVFSSCITGLNQGEIRFKTKVLAERAIKILGEETIMLALSNDY